MYIKKGKRMPLIRKFTAAGLALTIVLAFQVPTKADNMSSLQSQYDSLQQQQEQLQQQVSQSQSKYSSEKKKKDAINASVKVTRDQISLLNSQIAALDAQITAKANDIKTTEKRIKENYNLFKQRLCAMYMEGDSSYLEVLFSSDSLTSFLSRFDAVRFISQHDTELISSLKSDAEKLKADQSALQTKRKSLVSAQGTIAAKKAVLDAQLKQQSDIVSGLKSDLNAKENNKSLTDAQINAIAAQMAEARARQLQGTSGSGNSGGGSTGGSSVSGNGIVGYAMGLVGCPYVSGGISPSGFDCSGFTQYVYANAAGKYLPHSAAGQAGYGTAVSKGNLQPGDLVFFATSGGGINHVGIYVGGGSFIAANTGHAYRVQVQPLFSGYWGARYVCARHL